jgi:hypothetical protein
VSKAGDPMELLGCHDEYEVQVFVKTAVDKYNTLDIAFQLLLYLLILFMMKSPPRGMEMTSIKFMNSRDGMRDIKAVLGRLILMTTYHKSIEIIDNTNVYFISIVSILIIDYCEIPPVMSHQATHLVSTVCFTIPTVSEWGHFYDRQCVFIWK